MDEIEAPAIKPPWFPFQTFWGFITGLSEKPLPPQIDRSMMGTKSGSDQMNLFSTLKFFSLIDENNSVEPKLKELVAATPDSRKLILMSMLRDNYAAQFEVSDQNGTEKQLLDSFEPTGYGNDTRRKAMTFFLHAAREAGLTLSPHFPATRMGSGRSNPPRVSRIRKKSSQLSGGGTPSSGAKVHKTGGAGEPFVLNLNSGGQVTVAVSVDLWTLDDHDRDFVIELVDKIRGYTVRPELSSRSETSQPEESEEENDL